MQIRIIYVLPCFSENLVAKLDYFSMKTTIKVCFYELCYTDTVQEVLGYITRKKIPNWIIDKNKKKINQVGKVTKKNGSNKEKNRSSEKDCLPTDKNYKSMDWCWRNP